ncbi:23 kDa integral membrane protein-like isoform X2 [Salarias fasciatus]|uniref:23 kDa integral membrane protein-like n=1 Tax=Salarias fasciatus TaxID=181472 RepID=A0A672FRI5_SALFA|nr:23 kDa integral membrane protein-like isoform X1 [Salarias fasciatus]XP_029969404.1 23 kDa integral membrane protein-like isoform X2 [Salarias fasciatus]
MAGCRSYLRGLSICVTVLLLVSGVVMIGVGFSPIDGNIPAAELFDQLSSSDGLLVLQVFGPLTVILSVLGICGASLDLKPLLLVFSTLIFVEFVALMVVASPLVQVQAQMDGAVDELFLNVTPLHRADGGVQRELNKLQSSDSCCGLRSYEDWDNRLPVSCFCDPPVTPFDLQSSSQQRNSSSEGPCVKLDGGIHPAGFWVHSKPCGPILKSYVGFPIKLRIGIISAFATITVAAIALCLALGLEEYWKTPPVETTVDEFNRVKYQPKPTLT